MRIIKVLRLRLRIASYVLFLFSFNLCAGDTHKIGAGIYYNMDQSSTTGSGVYYQWKFGETFELEASYVFSNQLEISNNDSLIKGEFDHLLLGINYSKFLNQQWAFKAGAGFGQVTNSSNDKLISAESTAPYIKLGTSYKVSANFDVEFGGMTYFQDNVLDTNHSVYLSLTYTFGNKSATFNKVKTVSATEKTPLTILPVLPLSDSTKTPKNTVKNNLSNECQEALIDEKFWVIQLDAFENKENAEKGLQLYKDKIPLGQFTIIFRQGYYRVISQEFESFADASKAFTYIKDNYKDIGYVRDLNTIENNTKNSCQENK